MNSKEHTKMASLEICEREKQKIKNQTIASIIMNQRKNSTTILDRTKVPRIKLN